MINIEHDYFYGTAGEQFLFYRIPKVLFTAPEYRDISAEAKILYGLLLDRMCLSAKNGWRDEHNRVYIIYTIKEIMEDMGCADKKAGRLLDELENKCGLIERKRRGLGKPNLIYVKQFFGPSEARIQNRENDDSGNVKSTGQESSEPRCNNTDFSEPDSNDTENPSIYPRKGMDASEWEAYRKQIKDNVDYDALIHDLPEDAATISEMVELLVDAVCSSKQTICIAKEEKSAEVVRSHLLKLNGEHIKYVLDSLKSNTTRVRNMRAYLLTSLYNAPLSMDNHYRSWLSHNMANNGI